MNGRRSGVDVLTFGCRLNLAESDAIAAAASAAGHDDLVVVNTCAVTAEAVRQAGQAIRRVSRRRPGTPIVVTGCAAETEPERFRAMAEVDRLVPNRLKSASATWGRPGGALSGRAPPAAPLPTHTRSFVEIQNGCDHRCTFCIIPLGRGASRSTHPDRLVGAVRDRVEAGTREIVLTGVDLTSYEADGLKLGGLVRRVLRAVPELERLRLSSVDCVEADADLFAAFAEEPRLMPHLHLSLQSGSDLVLKRMKRRHGRADAARFCATLRALRPEIVFGADLIAGFPTEAEDHHRDSERLIEDCGLTHVHVFPYSPRPGTPAVRMPQVSGEIARARAARLRELGAERLRAHLDRQVGRTLRVLTERGGRGRVEDFTAVRPGDVEPNRMLDVLVTGHDGRELLGTPVSSGARSSCS